MMLDFAKQTVELHGTANTEMKVISFTKSLVVSQIDAFVRIKAQLNGFLLQQVILEPAQFTSVNFTCYAEGWYLFFMPRFLFYSSI